VWALVLPVPPTPSVCPGARHGVAPDRPTASRGSRARGAFGRARIGAGGGTARRTHTGEYLASQSGWGVANAGCARRIGRRPGEDGESFTPPRP
jgi:hypothetical protein